MRLMVFCEDCNYEYRVIAYQPPRSAEDEGLSKCPKCKERNRVGYLILDAKAVA